MLDKLYSIGMNDAMITSSVLTIIITIGAILVSRKLDPNNPKGMQNVIELGVEKLYGFFHNLMGEYLCKRYFPLVGTLFIWILICNYSGLLPLMGKANGMQAPTSDINFPLGMALVVLIALQVISVREHRGLKAYKRLVSPFVFMLPLMLIDDIAKPLSLTFRLYGNTFGDEEVVHIFGELVPIGLPVLMQFLVVLFALIQALVFSLLTAIYIGEFCEGAPGLEEHKLS